MIRSALCFAAACGLYVAGVAGCLVTTAALAKHLEITGCRSEARLAGLDPSYCEHR
jgi:hypothetical protein